VLSQVQLLLKAGSSDHRRLLQREPKGRRTNWGSFTIQGRSDSSLVGSSTTDQGSKRSHLHVNVGFSARFIRDGIKALPFVPACLSHSCYVLGHLHRYKEGHKLLAELDR
jgi:hypothetical protein